MPVHQKPPPGFAFIEDYVDTKGVVLVPGIATRLGISPHTYRKWRMAGKGPLTTLHGKKVMASEAAIDAYLASLDRAAAEPRHEMRPPEPRTATRRTRKSSAATAAETAVLVEEKPAA